MAEYDRKTRGEDGIILDTKFEDLKSSRKTKERRSQLINKFKAWGFALRHEAKLYQWAITWYKCRVNLGSIEQYVSDESERINQQANQLSDHELELYYHNGGETAYPERSNIENGIAPYDEATGYPRKWHE